MTVLSISIYLDTDCPFFFFLLWKKFKHLHQRNFGDVGSTLVVVMVEKKNFLEEISRSCNIPGSVLHEFLEEQIKSLIFVWVKHQATEQTAAFAA